MQVSASPIASCRSTAATDESTPPERPQITVPLPTWRRMRATCLGAEGRHGPVGGAARDARGEILQKRRAARRVHHFGMELHAVEAALIVGDGGEGRAVADRDDAKARRQGHDAVAMAHPHLLARALLPQPVEERAVYPPPR